MIQDGLVTSSFVIWLSVMDRSSVNRLDSKQKSSDHKSKHHSSRHARHHKEDERKRKRTYDSHDRQIH